MSMIALFFVNSYRYFGGRAVNKHDPSQWRASAEMEYGPVVGHSCWVSNGNPARCHHQLKSCAGMFDRLKPYVTTGAIFTPGRSFLGCFNTSMIFLESFFDFSWICLGYKTLQKLFRHLYVFVQCGHCKPLSVTGKVRNRKFTWWSAQSMWIVERRKQLSLLFCWLLPIYGRPM